jgi:O-antigen/teichoic acid export membrane protein
MSTPQSIFKNTSWLMASQIITSVLAFVWTVLIARYLGVNEFGIIAFATSFTSISSIFMDLGLSTYVTRNLSRDPELTSKYLGNIIPLKIAISLLTIAVVIILLFILNYNILTIIITIIFGIQVILCSMVALLSGIFQAHGKMKYQSIGIIINSIVLVISVILTIYLNLGVISIALGYLIGMTISLSYSYKKTYDNIGIPKFELDFDFWKSSVRFAFAFGLTGFFTTIYFLIDTVMLSMLKDEVAVGIYSSAYKVIMVFTTLYAVYNFVIFPLMSKLYKDSEDLLKISYEKSIKYLLMIILPIAIGILVYGKEIIILIYGSTYETASSVLVILIWNIVFLFINGASTLLLNSSNHEVSVTKINGLACIVNVVLNVVLIYYLSYIGASIATVITGLLILILMTYIISKDIFTIEKSLLIDILKIILSSIIVGVVLYLIHLPLILAIPLAIIIYLILLLLTKSFDNTDMYLIKEIFKKD